MRRKSGAWAVTIRGPHAGARRPDPAQCVSLLSELRSFGSGQGHASLRVLAGPSTFFLESTDARLVWARATDGKQEPLTRSEARPH